MDFQKDYNEYFYEPFVNYVDETSPDVSAEIVIPKDGIDTAKEGYDLVLEIVEVIKAHEQEGCLRTILAEVSQLLLKKNKDYGGSVFQAPVFCPSLPVESAILCRISDKYNRWQNLKNSEETSAVEETISETLRDMLGYAIILCMVLNAEDVAVDTTSDVLVFYPQSMPLRELLNRLQLGDVHAIPQN